MTMTTMTMTMGETRRTGTRVDHLQAQDRQAAVAEGHEEAEAEEEEVVEQVPAKADEARKVVPRPAVGHHPSALARSAREALAMMARETPAARVKMLAPPPPSSCRAPRRDALSTAHHCRTASITPAFSASLFTSSSSSISTSRIRRVHTRRTGTAATLLSSCQTCRLRCLCHQIWEAVVR